MIFFLLCRPNGFVVQYPEVFLENVPENIHIKFTSLKLYWMLSECFFQLLIDNRLIDKNFKIILYVHIAFSQSRLRCFNAFIALKDDTYYFPVATVLIILKF